MHVTGLQPALQPALQRAASALQNRRAACFYGWKSNEFERRSSGAMRVARPPGAAHGRVGGHPGAALRIWD